MSNSMDPETLEREANARRANLNDTLNSVEQRFSPNQMVQQAVDYFGEHGGDITQSVSRSVKANPLPLIITGIGLAWLISSQSRSTASYDENSRYRDRLLRGDDNPYRPGRTRGAYAQNARSVIGASPEGHDGLDYDLYEDEDESMMDSAREAAENFSRTVGQWRNELQTKLQSVKQDAGETVEQWRERVINTSVEQAEGIDQQYRKLNRSAGNWRDDLQARLKTVKQESGESAEQWRDRVVSTSVEQAESLDQQYRQARQQIVAKSRQHAQSTKNWMQEQPLVAGALGVAAGALIGSLLPSSRVEDELVGDRADSLKSSLATRAESASEEVASSVEDTAQTLRAKGEEQIDQAKTKDSSVEPA